MRNVIYKSQCTAVHSIGTGSSIERTNVVSIIESPKFLHTVGLDPSEIRRDGMACARGVGSAFLVEVGMALLGCAVWLAWRFVH